MKRISRFSLIAGAVVAAVALVDIGPISKSSAQAGGYGYGYSPYGYRVGPGYVYPSTNAYGQRIPYVGAPGTVYSYHSNQTLPSYNPYGYGSRFSYGGSRVYSPYGYGPYSAYGF